MSLDNQTWIRTGGKTWRVVFDEAPVEPSFLATQLGLANACDLTPGWGRTEPSLQNSLFGGLFGALG